MVDSRLVALHLMNQIERKDEKKNLRFGQHKYECNFLLAASFHYFFFLNEIHVPLFFCRYAMSATQKTKQNKNQNKTKKLPNPINYFVLECVSILYYHRPIVQFVNSWHWRECAKEIKILLNGFIKTLDRLLDTRIYKTDRYSILRWVFHFVLK